MASQGKDQELLDRVKEIMPNYYTERDGGDWYVLAPYHDRIAEDFSRRDDARRFLAWVGGDPIPDGWSISNVNGLSADLDCGQGYRATIWTRSIRHAMGDRFDEMIAEQSTPPTP